MSNPDNQDAQTNTDAKAEMDTAPLTEMPSGVLEDTGADTLIEVPAVFSNETELLKFCCDNMMFPFNSGDVQSLNGGEQNIYNLPKTNVGNEVKYLLSMFLAEEIMASDKSRNLLKALVGETGNWTNIYIHRHIFLSEDQLTTVEKNWTFRLVLIERLEEIGVKLFASTGKEG